MFSLLLVTLGVLAGTSRGLVPEIGCDKTITNIDTEPQEGASLPYTITADKTTYTPLNGGINIKITSTDAEKQIYGLYIRAERVNDGEVVGEFIVPVGAQNYTDIQLTTCNDVYYTGWVNVAELIDKEEVDLQWRYWGDVPDSWDGQVKIVVSVLASATEYWSDIEVATVTIEQGDDVAKLACESVVLQDVSRCVNFSVDTPSFDEEPSSYCPYFSYIMDCINITLSTIQSIGCPALQEDYTTRLREACPAGGDGEEGGGGGMDACFMSLGQCNPNSDESNDQEDDVLNEEKCRNLVLQYSCRISTLNSQSCIDMIHKEQFMQHFGPYLLQTIASCSSIVPCSEKPESCVTNMEVDQTEQQQTMGNCSVWLSVLNCVAERPESCRSWIPDDVIQSINTTASQLVCDSTAECTTLLMPCSARLEEVTQDGSVQVATVEECRAYLDLLDCSIAAFNHAACSSYPNIAEQRDAMVHGRLAMAALCTTNISQICDDVSSGCATRLKDLADEFEAQTDISAEELTIDSDISCSFLNQTMQCMRTDYSACHTGWMVDPTRLVREYNSVCDASMEWTADSGEQEGEQTSDDGGAGDDGSSQTTAAYDLGNSASNTRLHAVVGVVSVVMAGVLAVWH